MAISVMQQPTLRCRRRLRACARPSFCLSQGVTAAPSHPYRLSVGPSETGLSSSSSDDVRVERQSHFPPLRRITATLPSIWTADRRRGQAQKMRASTTREGEGLPSRLVRFVGGRCRRRWEPPWVLQMQRKRPNTRNITPTRAGGASSEQDAGRRRHLMPLVNCGEGGREKANSQTDKLRATREVAELRAEGEKERGGQCIINLRRNTPRSLAGLATRGASEQVSLFRRSTWGMFKINKERSGGPPSIDHDDRWNDRQMMTKVIVPPSLLPSVRPTRRGREGRLIPL